MFISIIWDLKNRNPEQISILLIINIFPPSEAYLNSLAETLLT